MSISVLFLTIRQNINFYQTEADVSGVSERLCNFPCVKCTMQALMFAFTKTMVTD